MLTEDGKRDNSELNYSKHSWNLEAFNFVMNILISLICYCPKKSEFTCNFCVILNLSVQ
jgi:hypothetical protein